MARGVLLLVLVAACAKPAHAPAVARPPLSPASAPLPPSAPAAAAPATIPELTPEAFTVDGTTYFDAAYAIDGATILTRANVTGYVTADDKVEWIAKVPKEMVVGGMTVGSNRIYDVRGQYPDSIDVFYESLGRAPMPTYLPLTGKGSIFVAGNGGAWGNLLSTRIGASTLIAKWGSMDPYEILTVRGPTLVRKFQP